MPAGGKTGTREKIHADKHGQSPGPGGIGQPAKVTSATGNPVVCLEPDQGITGKAGEGSGERRTEDVGLEAGNGKRGGTLEGPPGIDMERKAGEEGDPCLRLAAGAHAIVA